MAITLFCAKLEPMKRSVRFRAFSLLSAFLNNVKGFHRQRKQMSLKERYIYQAFSQLKITAPRSLVPVCQPFISRMIFSTRMPSVSDGLPQTCLEDSDLDADFLYRQNHYFIHLILGIPILFSVLILLFDSGSSRFILIGLKLRASSDMSMSSLYGCPARHSVRPLSLEVHENHCCIVEYHCNEEKEYYLSVLHGCCNMMLDERAELSCGSGRICSPSLMPRLSRRSLRSVVPV